MKEWDLDEIEIASATLGIPEDSEASPADLYCAIGKAYQKKLVEWMEATCDNSEHCLWGEVRYDCGECWQELLDDLGVK